MQASRRSRTKPREGRPATPERARPPARPHADSIERATAQIGDTWTFLILREAFFGVRRFDAFQANLGVAPNTLTDRLKKLVAHEILSRSRYEERPPRFEYRLTEKGLDLYPAIVLLMRWGDRWLDEKRGAPLSLTHERCGAVTRPILVCDACGEPIAAREMRWRPGPGAKR